MAVEGDTEECRLGSASRRGGMLEQNGRKKVFSITCIALLRTIKKGEVDLQTTKSNNPSWTPPVDRRLQPREETGKEFTTEEATVKP